MRKKQHHIFSRTHPLFTFVYGQAVFWLLANLLLAFVARMMSRLVALKAGIPPSGYGHLLFGSAAIFGLLYGSVLGLLDYWIDRRNLRNRSVSIAILLRMATTLGLLVAFTGIFLAGVLPLVADKSWAEAIARKPGQYWKLFFVSVAVYYFCAGTVAAVLNQVRYSYGTGRFMPLVLGRYRRPREEARAFLFLDLDSSTARAERLGHIRYSAFIRDCMLDINGALRPFQAEIYQYVGDEVVLTWECGASGDPAEGVLLFWACDALFRRKEKYYLDHYGEVPQFKGALHAGRVTGVEIGDLKREIAYHGDPLNATARMLSLCSQYNLRLVASAEIVRNLDKQDFILTDLGDVQLRGRSAPLSVYGVALK